MKYVIVTGGVVSGLGKGITASSVGLLLKACGVRVTAIKIDPYLNIDAGTMSPYEHGEVFVLDDGGEVDLDLGNYERFLDVHLTRDHNITTGKVYQRVLNTERRGGYLGKTVQMIPHVSNCIIDWITEVSAIPVDDSGLTPEVCMIELGGTVGDIESMIFLEAIRLLRYRYRRDVCLLHVSLIVSLGNVGELKSKPTQHSMIPLRAAGLLPDCLVLRCCKQVPQTIIDKVSISSMVPIENIMVVPDVNNIYEVPNILLKQNIVQNIFHVLSMNDKRDKNIFLNLSKFNYIALQLKTTTANKKQHTNSSIAHASNFRRKISIGIVGKYTGLMDSYLSVTKALLSASCMCNLELEMVWIESQDLETYLPSFMKQIDSKEEEEVGNEMYSDIVNDFSKTFLNKNFMKSEDESLTNGDCDNISNSSADIIENADVVHNITVKASPVKIRGKQSLDASKCAWKKLSKVDGILIPGGFGDRGIEGKILAVEYARVHKKPFLGICLGLQLAVVEFCRNVLQMKNANSTEFDDGCKYPCVIFMPEGRNKANMGGTMRLGARMCNLMSNSLAQHLYGKEQISERHRHRYEVNPEFVEKIEAHGLRFSGKDVKNERMEIIELPVSKHPFFFGTQFHPEFKSGPLRASPPFIGLIKASAGILHKEPEFMKEFAGELN